jgi:hypothetical protein
MTVEGIVILIFAIIGIGVFIIFPLCLFSSFDKLCSKAEKEIRKRYAQEEDARGNPAKAQD